MLPGWSLAITLNIDIPTPTTLRLGGEGHRVILNRCDPLAKQWQQLQTQSQKNFNAGGKAIAYLITPGVFEYPQPVGANKIQSVCRAWPWEWKLTHCGGNLVSVATAQPTPISCRIRDPNDETKSIPAPQVFAAPAGSMYYLNHPQDLYQNNPTATNSKSSQKAKRWRKLGYSELLWVSFSH